jgi:hypothetical protein
MPFHRNVSRERRMTAILAIHEERTMIQMRADRLAKRPAFLSEVRLVTVRNWGKGADEHKEKG